MQFKPTTLPTTSFQWHLLWSLPGFSWQQYLPLKKKKLLVFFICNILMARASFGGCSDCILHEGPISKEMQSTLKMEPKFPFITGYEYIFSVLKFFLNIYIFICNIDWVNKSCYTMSSSSEMLPTLGHGSRGTITREPAFCLDRDDLH